MRIGAYAHMYEPHCDDVRAQRLRCFVRALTPQNFAGCDLKKNGTTGDASLLSAPLFTKLGYLWRTRDKQDVSYFASGDAC